MIMDNPKHVFGSLATILLLAGVILMYHWFFSFSSELVLTQKESLCKQSNFTTTTDIEEHGDALDSALVKASMENKTVIIVVVNRAYVDQDVESDTTMLDLFLDNFWLGEGTRPLINHLLVVAVDQTAYDRCQFLKLNCFKLKIDGVDFEGEKIFMSQDYIKMTWTKIQFVLEVLKRGYNIVFTDADIMWLRNPFIRLSKNETQDIQISTDRYLGDPWSKSPINTGFYFVRSNNNTISLFETWYGQKDNATTKNDQDVLFYLIKSGIIEDLGLRVRYLETIYFSGFCEDSKDFRKVVTVHANCCKSITAKMADMKTALQDWKRFRRLEDNSTMNPQWTKHKRCNQSWRNL